jgi:hypothetical protein
MRNTTMIVLLAILAGCSSKNEEKHPPGHPQTGDSQKGHDMSKMGGMAGTLMVKTDPAEVKAGQPTKLTLMIHDAGGAMLKDFEVVHEQRIHLIVVSDGLDQFAHIHPDIDSVGNLTVTHTFPTGGKYRLYADHKPAGKDQATAMGEVKVSGDSPPAPKLIPNAPGRVTGDGLNADVALENAKAGGVTRITLSLMDLSDKPVADLQPYLGAGGHLVILSADGAQYVHAHSEDEKPTNGKVVFEAHFSQPGIYKAWGQFQRAGKVHTIPFVMETDG